MAKFSGGKTFYKDKKRRKVQKAKGMEMNEN